jgi:hypothetical protein
LIFNFFKNKFDSNILDSDSKKKLSELCQFPNGQRWRLLYRATRDGFGAKDFHRKCDHFENTLVVIKSTAGNVFGGFTSKPWNSSATRDKCHYIQIKDSLTKLRNSCLIATYGYVQDESAFIFSLVNKFSEPLKTVYSSDQGIGIFCDIDAGPSFGYCEPILSLSLNINYYTIHYDLRVSTDSNVDQSSCSNFGYGFKNQKYQRERYKANAILAGSYHFQSVEIEVFTNLD